MSRGHDKLLSVIVPTYNEKENIGVLIEKVSRVLREKGILFEMLVMDDDSPDGTSKTVGKMSGQYPEARCIVRKEDRGLSPSVIDGFRAAKGEVLLVMDADLSHPPEVVPKLYDAIIKGRADVSVGSRHARGGGTEDWPFSRKFISWGASLMARPLTSCSDPMSGFFAVRRSVVEGAPLRAKGYKILLEVLVKGKYKKVSEVPILFRDREKGQSKLGSKVIVNYLQHLIQLYLYPGSAPFFKFLFVGGTGFFVDEGLFKLMLLLLGGDLDYIWQSFSFIAAVIWNFIWNRIWTFDASSGNRSRQFLRFFGVAAIAYLIRSGLYVGGSAAFGPDTDIEKMVLLFFVIVIVTVINYIGSKLWAFKKDVK